MGLGLGNVAVTRKLLSSLTRSIVLGAGRGSHDDTSIPLQENSHTEVPAMTLAYCYEETCIEVPAMTLAYYFEETRMETTSIMFFKFLAKARQSDRATMRLLQMRVTCMATDRLMEDNNETRMRMRNRIGGEAFKIKTSKDLKKTRMGNLLCRMTPSLNYHCDATLKARQPFSLYLTFLD